MLKKAKMQEILALKQRGYSINEICAYYAEKEGKTPSLPTIRKYYGMDMVPKIPNKNLIKDKVFDHEPYRSTIIELLKNNPSCYLSSLYDVLQERYVESGTSKSLPGNEQTLRHYVHYLQANKLIDLEPASNVYTTMSLIRRQDSRCFWTLDRYISALIQISILSAHCCVTAG